jgi:hypothetical protein
MNMPPSLEPVVTWRMKIFKNQGLEILMNPAPECILKIFNNPPPPPPPPPPLAVIKIVDPAFFHQLPHQPFPNNVGCIGDKMQLLKMG